MTTGSQLIASSSGSLLTTDNVSRALVQSSQMNPQQVTEIARLRSTNALYDEYKPLWDFYLASYEGGQDFANEENVNRHPRENPEDFAERVKRIHYLNYCEPLVDFFTAFIFAETIQRDGGSNDDFYKSFIKDVNKKGDDITAFMQQISDAKQIFGMVYVMVDSPELPANAVTKAQQEALGIKPYWIMVKPDEVLDWSVDSFDQYQYFKRCQIVRQFNEDSRTLLTIERYYEWFPDKVTITDIDVTKSSNPVLLAPRTISNAIGQVPVVLLRYKKSIKNKYMGNSFLRDIAYNNKEVLNLTSLP